MSVWFSEFHVRTLAERIAPRIAPTVEVALVAAIRAELPRLLMDELRIMLPDHTPKCGARKGERNALIRARYNGTNVSALAREFCLNERQIYRILKT
ncbi:MAG: hypothetical protein MUE49_14645 [Rhodospirillales bacterium]|jgi:hypothetical protein|nr:hypothetical protein [Rhodospirillales bacterium]